MITKQIIVSLLALLLFTQSFAQKKSELQKISAKEFKTLMDSLTTKQIIDVRTPEEFKSGHIGAAKNINIYDADFLQRLGSLDKKTPVFVYCKGGVRSADAVKQMQLMGFSRIYDLQGGIMSWENNEYPISDAVAPEKEMFTQADFDSVLTSNPTLLVDFYADWCMPCKEMEPALHRVAKEYKGKVVVYRINVDEAKELTKMLQINGIPVIATYKNGKEIQRVVGLQSASELRKMAKRLSK